MSLLFKSFGYLALYAKFFLKMFHLYLFYFFVCDMFQLLINLWTFHRILQPYFLFGFKISKLAAYYNFLLLKCQILIYFLFIFGLLVEETIQ